MTQSQAIAKGYTHFIEVYRDSRFKEGGNLIVKGYISSLDYVTQDTKSNCYLYTVAIFLIKFKPKQ